MAHEPSTIAERFDIFLDGTPVTRGRLLNLVSVIGVLILWELASRALGQILLAPPSAVLDAFQDLIAEGTLVEAIIGSSQALIVGYVLSAVVAIPLGFAIAQSKYVEWALGPYIDAVYTTPTIVYLPLVVVWFGLGFRARVFFVFIFAFFEMLINTTEGVRDTKENFSSVSRSFGATWWKNQRLVVLPASLPFIFAGLRLGVGRAVRGVIVAEIFLQVVNLGQLLKNSAAVLDTSIQLAVIITIAVIGVLLQKIVLLTSKKVTPWYYAIGGEV